MKKSIVATCIVVTLIHLAGCGAAMTVRYTPVASVATIRPSDAPRVHVAVTKFSEGGQVGDEIGAMRNIYGMRLVGLKTSRDLGQLMAEATADALKKAGVDAELRSEAEFADSIHSLRSDYDAVVGGRISEIHVNTKPTFSSLIGKAKVSIMLTIWESGREFEVGPIVGEAEDAGGHAAASEALDAAIGDYVRQMIDQLRAEGHFAHTK